MGLLNRISYEWDVCLINRYIATICGSSYTHEIAHSPIVTPLVRVIYGHHLSMQKLDTVDNVDIVDTVKSDRLSL